MKKQVSLIMLGLLLISMIAFLPNIAHSYTPADYKASIIAAAGRLVALQSVLPGPPADGGWDWIVTGLASHTAGASARNLFGVTALGLIDAYELTGNMAYLTAAKNTADFMKYGNPSIGDFYNGYGAYRWGYSYDYRFLMSYSAVSGDPSYKDYALLAWAWQKANIAAFANGDALWAIYPDDGYAAWGTSDWGLATLKMGDAPWATNMATVMHNHMAGILASDPMAMGATLRFLATIGGYAGDVTLLKDKLVTLQQLDGSWQFPGYPYPCTQSVAYAVMGLWAAGEYTAARKGADWLVSTQGTLVALSGGWPQTNYDPTYCETSETDSEPLQAIYTVTSYASKLYISPSPVNKAPGDVNSFFDVYVTLENFGNLMGFDIKLTWDSSLITETSHDYTTYLDALWGAGKWFKAFEDSGAGYYELAASSISTAASNTGASILFKKTFQIVKSCNFPLSTPIHFAVVKLSDNTEPIPNPIVPATVTDGQYTMSNTKPDLEIVVVGQYHAPPFEYCDTFEVEVYVTHICVNSPLTDYHLKIQYGTHLAKFMQMDAWGIFGLGTVIETTPGEIVVEGAGSGWWGDKGLLFKLTFHVEFANTEEHVWKLGNANYETFNIAIIDATLSFATGTIPISGILMPAPVTIRVNFIRGDVDCNGVVNLADIGSAAYYYDKTSADPLWISTIRRYDLNNDNIIDIYDIVAIATNYGYGNPHH